MLIKTKTGFLHGRVQFLPDQIYDVHDAFGGYFVGVGWAQIVLDAGDEKVHAVTLNMLGSDAPPPVRVDKSLEVEDVRIGVEDIGVLPTKGD